MDKEFKRDLIVFIICLPFFIFTAIYLNSSAYPNDYGKSDSAMDTAMNIKMDIFKASAKSYFESQKSYSDICGSYPGFMKILKSADTDPDTLYASCSSNKNNWAVCISLNILHAPSPSWTSVVNYCSDSHGNRIRVSNEACKAVNNNPFCK